MFGVPAGKLLSFIVSQRGIQANLEKISAITKMSPPTSIKDVSEAYGMYGCAEQVRIPPPRMRVAIFQIIEEAKQLRVESRSTGGF